MTTRVQSLTSEAVCRLAWNLTIHQAAVMMLRAWRETASGMRGTDPTLMVDGRDAASRMARAESTPSGRLLSGNETIQAAVMSLSARREPG